MIRYAMITEKNPREIVMLRGSGCKWRRCRFCDYHLDYSKDEAANFALNSTQLQKVTGKYHCLEVINSGSFVDLDEQTLSLIEHICLEKDITQVHFECHWMHREAVADFRKRFADKGITTEDPAKIAQYFDEACLLFGLTGQTTASMKRDVETALTYFQRVCINIMTPNGSSLQPDDTVISLFARELYPLYAENPRIDILMENTDFGVGGN